MKIVEIIVESGNHYCLSHKNGAEFTSVDYSTSTQGAHSPCDSKEDVEKQIEYCKKEILQLGFKPVVIRRIKTEIIKKPLKQVGINDFLTQDL